ncbi:histamine H2 receptor-like isoform X1 [Hydractinia symbiolongicarpus]|uniref:histamine H2 receptor-like isoform X1 n=1 Tax=Hydractinia symbiolongicarpus TaxID=13093 RepID=UPI00254A573C|nr:histamine H2 receptor-like isoform X1 [Hydractinia symbiolongicarpus]
MSCNNTTLGMQQNCTSGTYIKPEAAIKEFIILNVIIATLAIIMNSFVVFLFYYKRTLLNTPSNRLLLSLCICDFLAGVIVTCHCLIEFEIFNHCLAFRIVLDIFTTMLVESVIIHLCGITLDRFLSLFYALRYKDIVTRKKSLKFIASAWIIPFFASSIQLTWLYRVLDGDPTENDYNKIDKIEPWYSASSFIIFFTVPMFLLGVIFVGMFIEIRRLLLKTPSRRMRDVSGVSVQQRRVFYIFGAMYLCFVLLSMPFFTMRFMLDLDRSVNHNILPNKHLLDIGYALKALNSLFDPIIYTAINREFRSLIGHLFSTPQNKFRFPFRKLSSAASLNVSMRRRSMPISSVADPSIHDSGIYEICLGDTTSEIDTNSSATSSLQNARQSKLLLGVKIMNNNLFSSL